MRKAELLDGGDWGSMFINFTIKKGGPVDHGVRLRYPKLGTHDATRFSLDVNCKLTYYLGCALDGLAAVRLFSDTKI